MDARTKQLLDAVTAGAIRPKQGGGEGCCPHGGDTSHVGRGFALAFRLTKAIAKWTAAGWPTCNEEQLKSRVESCHSCRYYEPKLDACRICGCNISLKAPMATEECPLSEPRKRWRSLA